MLVLQFLGWVAVMVGGIIVVAFGLLFLLVARSRFLPKNPDRRREALGPLWRLIPAWLYLSFATGRLAYTLLADAREPRWFMPVGLFLCGMFVWSTLETLLLARKRRTQERREQEAYRRDTRSEP